MSQRQTISFLTQRFADAGIRPVTRNGQNFLVDLNLVDLLVNSGQLSKRDVVLEVGTGTGSLTAMMAKLAAHVITVEIDAQLYQLASEELVKFDNVTMLQQDALRNKNNLDSRLLAAVQEQLDTHPDSRLKLVANLPYNIATPIVSNLLTLDAPPHSMTVTIQLELAQRITARPKTKDYSALSIWVQSQCEASIVRELSPDVFWPRPKVNSAIIQVEPRQHLRDRIRDRVFFHQFVRSMFFHRRKLLRSCIVSAHKGLLTKPDADEIISEMELRPDARAEQLSVEQMLDLSDRIQSRLE